MVPVEPDTQPVGPARARSAAIGRGSEGETTAYYGKDRVHRCVRGSLHRLQGILYYCYYFTIPRVLYLSSQPSTPTRR